MPHPSLLVPFQRGDGIEDMKAEDPCCPCRHPMEGWGDGESCRHLSVHSLSRNHQLQSPPCSCLSSPHTLSPLILFLHQGLSRERPLSYREVVTAARSLGLALALPFAAGHLLCLGGQAPCISCHIPVAFCCGWWTRDSSGEEVWQAQGRVTASGEGQGFVSSQVCATMESRCLQA